MRSSSHQSHSGCVGYANKHFTAVVFPNYFFGVGSTSDRDPTTQPTRSKLSLLYALTYNLPEAWQIGFNPTITYNHNASSGNQGNVPVGLFVSKVIKVGRVPMKVQAALEYSVVSENDFGKRANFRFVIRFERTALRLRSRSRPGKSLPIEP